MREFGLQEPGDILDKTRELVIAEFEKSKEDVKDGMDIALCSLSIHEQDSAKTNKSNPRIPSTNYQWMRSGHWRDQ